MSASETKWVRLGDYIVQQDERNFFEKYPVRTRPFFSRAIYSFYSLAPNLTATRGLTRGEVLARHSTGRNFAVSTSLCRRLRYNVSWWKPTTG